MVPDPSLPSKTPPLWRRVLPFVVGGSLVVWVASKLDYAAFTRAMRSIHVVGFVAFAFVFCAAILVTDVLATVYVYRKTIAPVGYRDILIIRAAAYVPSLLNHHVGQAWLTYFLSKAYGVPIARAAGSTLLVYATTFGALFMFLLFGVPLDHGRVSWLLPTVIVIGTAGLLYAFALVVKPEFLTRIAALAPLFDAGLPGHLGALAVRMPHLIVQFAGAWVPFLFFHIDIPFGDALAIIPILMFVVTLPVSPQGMGTREALSIALVSSYAEGAPAERASVIVASTVSWAVVVTLIYLVFAPLFMKPAYALLGRTRTEKES